MESTNKFLEINKDKIPETYEFLQLSYKDKETGKKYFTGKHILKIVSDERTTKKDAVGYMQEILRYKFVEKLKDGTKKMVQYDFPCWAKDKEGEQVHYMVPKLAEFKIGDVVTLEMIPNGLKSFTEIHFYVPNLITKEQVEANALKTVDVDEVPQSKEQEISVDEEDEIDIKDIPF